jgi:hydrogenase small subunit
MAAAGHQAEQALHDTVEAHTGEYIAIVEGSIPTGANGAYCCIGGRSALDISREVCSQAAATIAIGTCAAFGGLPAASPNPTGALSVADAVPGLSTLINLPACPANAENLTATIIHYLTFGSWPATDGYGRPLFAYGKTIHDNCERRAHFNAGQYVEKWGDEGHRVGYCLYKMGCKGPVTYQNCPDIGWNENTNWPIGCGHPCVGCAEPDFWDRMTPFYEHIDTIGAGCTSADLDTVGLWATIGVAAAFGAHGATAISKRWMQQRRTPPVGSREAEELAPKKTGAEAKKTSAKAETEEGEDR